MPINIMLVEDQAAYRAHLKSYLEDCTPDLRVIAEAANGAEAIELAGRHQPDIILMDVRMPVMDGIEATRRITEQFPAIPIVGLSFEPEKWAAPDMLGAGAKSYLHKSVPVEVLESVIRSLHEGKEVPASGRQPAADTDANQPA